MNIKCFIGVDLDEINSILYKQLNKTTVKTH